MGVLKSDFYLDIGQLDERVGCGYINWASVVFGGEYGDWDMIILFRGIDEIEIYIYF